MSSSSEGRLVRVKLRFERDFTQLPNAWIRDELLSWKARGILQYLMSHETGFTVTLKSLPTAGTDGIAAVRAGVDELTDRGYLTREQTRTRHGNLGHVQWSLHDPHEQSYPQAQPSIRPEKSRSEPLCDFPSSDNRTTPPRAISRHRIIARQKKNKLKNIYL